MWHAAARIAAIVYAVILVITGLGMFASLVVLAQSFGVRTIANAPLLTTSVILAGIVLIVLAGFVWRQRIWAMVTGTVLSAILAYFLFDRTALVLVLLGLLPIVFAVLTAICVASRNRVTPA